MSRAKRILSASRYTAVSDLPTNKELGQTVFKGGVVYIYANLGGISTWYPLNTPQTSFIHNQGEPRLVWTIRHGLGSKDVIVSTYDNNNNLTEGSLQHLEDENTGEWYTTITYTEATSGYAVIFGRENLSATSISTTNLDVAGTLTLGGESVALQSDVDREVNDRTAALTTVNQSLVGEINRAKAKETALEQDITDERLRAEAADAALQQAIDDEINARTNAVGGVQSQIDAMGSAFNYSGTLPDMVGVSGSGSETDPYVVDTMNPGTKDAGDYYKITESAHYRVNAGEGNEQTLSLQVGDGVVFNTAGGLDRINNQQSTLTGTAGEIVVTGSVESGYRVSVAQAVKDSVVAVDSRVSAESTRAVTKENALQADIDSEVSTRSSQVAALTGDLDDEVNRAKAKENALTGSLNTEIARATAAEADLQQDIDDEVSARTDAVNAVDSRVTGEINRATTKEEALQEAIDDEASARASAVSAVSSSLTTEINRAKGRENTIESNLTSEISRAKAKENALQDDIDDEVSARTSAVSSVNSALTSEINRAKARENAIETTANSKLPISHVINNVTSSNTDRALSANQGRLLNTNKLNRSDVLNTLGSTSTTQALSAAQGRSLKIYIDSNVTTLNNAINGKLATNGKAYDSHRLGGVAAASYITVNDTIDLGHV